MDLTYRYHQKYIAVVNFNTAAGNVLPLNRWYVEYKPTKDSLEFTVFYKFSGINMRDDVEVNLDAVVSVKDIEKLLVDGVIWNIERHLDLGLFTAVEKEKSLRNSLLWYLEKEKTYAEAGIRFQR